MRALHPNLSRLLILANSALFALLVACGGGGYGGGGGGGGGGMLCGGIYSACPPPTVSITAPAANAAVKGTVALTATATASAQFNLTITSVEFDVDGTMVGTVTAAPYTFNWDSTKVANGNHTITAKATDSHSDSATSAGVVVVVGNAGVMATAMSASEIFPTPVSRASGTARVNLQEGGALSGSVTLSGMTARSVTINMGFAGSTGEQVLALTPHGGSATQFDVPAGTELAPEQATALMQGRLYVIATSRANPEGEVRGQLAPESVHVVFSALSASSEAARGAAATGMAATTLDTGAHTLSIHVSSSGLEVPTAASVSSGSAVLAELARDRIDTGHFSTELARISEADVQSFNAGRLSVSVASAAAPSGALGAQIRPTNE
ncbi:MAG TPA: CHRD domain-containing protein [Steroidobacteraceae bacterium]|nr:CHRD domain-containing protein [Steroidobacteraceae bacterium]